MTCMYYYSDDGYEYMYGDGDGTWYDWSYSYGGDGGMYYDSR